MTAPQAHPRLAHQDSYAPPTIATAAPLAPTLSPPFNEKHAANFPPRTSSEQDLNEKSETKLQRTPTSSSSDTALTHHTNDLENVVSRISTDPLGNTYPEGGREAYLVVLGSFSGCIMGLGLMNTLSTYTAYVSSHQLSHVPESTIGWIFGIYAFLSFFLGIQIGPLFDAFGPRYLVGTGSIFILLTYILLAQCSQYWHFILVFSILGGSGTSLVFTPSIAAIGHWFYLKRGTFTGLACVGGSLGGIIFPLALQALFAKPEIGWPWAQRTLALMNLPFAIMVNLFVRSRLPAKRPVEKSQIMPDWRIFKDPTFALVTLAVFFVEWGLFVPISYLTNFALSIGVDETFSYQLIAIFNAGSCLGRYLPGLIADRIGRFNATIATTVICWVSAFTFWLTPELLVDGLYSTRIALLIVFALVFGFGSGSGISLIPVCVGQLCRTEEYGRYYATCYTVVSFATLTGIPIAGALITATSGGRYWGLILFTGVSYAISTVIFMAAKATRTGYGKELWTAVF